MAWVVGKGARAFRGMEKKYGETATIGQKDAAMIAAAIDPRLQVRVAAFSKSVIVEDTEDVLASFCNKVKEEMEKNYPDHSFFGALSFYPFSYEPGGEEVTPRTWNGVVYGMFNSSIYGSSGRRETDGDYCFALLFARNDLYEEETGRAPPPKEKNVFVVCETNMTPDGGWPCAVFSDWNKARDECLRLAEKMRKLSVETHKEIEGARKAKRTARYYVDMSELEGMYGFGVKVKKIDEGGYENEGEWDTIFYVENYVLDKSAPKWV